MKTTIKFLSVLTFLISFASCESIEDLADVTFNTTLTDEIVVHIDQTNGTSAPFNMTQTISLDNADTHDYLSNIEEVNINSLSYKVINFSGDPAGTIDVEFFVDNVSQLANDFTVKIQADAGSIFEVTNTIQLNAIASALKSGQSVTAKYQGTALCDAADMDFTIEVTVGVTIVANPL